MVDIGKTTLEEIAQDFLHRLSRFSSVFVERESLVFPTVIEFLQEAYDCGYKANTISSCKQEDESLSELTKRFESNLIQFLEKTGGKLSGHYDLFKGICKNALSDAYLRGKWDGTWGDSEKASTVEKGSGNIPIEGKDGY